MEHEKRVIRQSIAFSLIVFAALTAIFLILLANIETVSRMVDGAEVFYLQTSIGDLPVKEMLIIFAGFIALLSSFLIFFMLAGGERARRIAARMLDEAVSSQQMLLQLYQNSPIPYLLVDNDLDIQFPNKAAMRLFGEKTEELEDKNLVDFIIDDEKDHVEILIARFKRNVQVNEEEVEISRSDGTTRWVIMSMFSLEGAEKKRNGLVSLVDITERKEIDRAKTEFVSLASHQLRTPLSAVKWYSELLASGDLGELSQRQQHYVDKIHYGNERMIDLVNTLLNVSRLELGTLIVEKKSVVLVDLAEGILEELAPSILEKNLHLKRHYSQSIPIIESDPKLLQMIFQNLLSNAIKYTPDGGSVTLQIGTQGNRLQILVSDTGMGIPTDEQDKIFSKLFRADNAREQVAEGTGLGLYIVQAVTRELGGEISFTSEVSRGTTFTVLLPL